jgi:hypothetical protein
MFDRGCKYPLIDWEKAAPSKISEKVKQWKKLAET